MDGSSDHHSSYGDAHADFVTTQTGTSHAEITKILITISLTPFLASLILPWAVPPSFAHHATKDSSLFTFIRALVEYPVIVVLPLWIVTVLAGQAQNETQITSWNNFALIVMVCSCLGLMLVNYTITEPKWVGFQSFWKKIKDQSFIAMSSDEGKNDLNKEESNSKGKTSPSTSGTTEKKLETTIKYPFITNYRGIVTYVTVIAILAVDFTIFPRRYSKTQKYGYSLMDIGTGSFIFSNAIVAPEAKNRKSNFRKSLLSCVPLALLGFVRLISVKGIDYHEVVEEYGVHWNFFFTLASVKLLSSTVFSCIEPSYSLKLSFIIGVLNEVFFVNFNNLESYLLNSSIPRDNLLDANREGLFSIFGYLCIYLASVYIGKLMYCVKNVTVKEWCLHSLRTGIHVGLLWVSFNLSITFGNPSCRRIANMSYCLWILATNYTILWTLMILSLLQKIAQHIGLLHGPLISHELKLAMDRDEQKIKQLNEKMQAKKRFGKIDKKSVVDVEETLALLEAQLKEFENSERNSGEVSDLIKHVEDELERISEYVKEDDDEHDDENFEKTQNLIPMPDLTMSPVTYEAICYNGLFVFLLGNILTGLVNCLVHTIYVPNYLALCYLWAYVTSVASCSIILYTYKIQLKFW